MVSQYSIGIHDYIDKKIETIKDLRKKAESTNNLLEKSFYEGQLQELHGIREYMAQHVDLKTQ